MKKLLKKSWVNIKRDRWFTFASILVMSFTFFMLSSFVTSAMLSNNVLSYLETRAQVTVFFKDSASTDAIFSHKTALENNPDILEVLYTSREDALQKYIGEHKDEPLLLESLSKDIFPASLDIKAVNVSNLSGISDYFSKVDEVEEVVYYEDAINSFRKFANFIRIGGIGLVILLSFTSIVVVMLTLGSSIYVKNEEIGVMRLVGANNWYIRAPFFVQGFLYSLFASLISEAVFITVIVFFKQDINLIFKGIPILNLGFLYLVSVFVFQVLFGLIVSLVAGYIAIRKYLKV